MTWRPVTGARQHRTPATFPKSLLNGPGLMIALRGRQKVRRRRCRAPLMFPKGAGEWRTGVQCWAQHENGTGYPQALVNYPEGIFRALAIHFFRETKGRDVMIVLISLSIHISSGLLQNTLGEGFPIWDTCTPSGRPIFAYFRGFI